MGTSILFKKQFIKVNNNYVPMVLSGSTNWFDCGNNGGNGRISRDWGIMKFHCNGELFATENEILNSIDKSVESTIKNNELSTYSSATADEVKKAYGYYIGLRIGSLSTTKTSSSRYRSFFSDGIKKALTIEELRLKGVSVYLTVSHYNKETVLAAGLKMRNDAYMNTTEEFEAAMIEWSLYYGKTAGVYVSYGSEDQLERLFESNRKPIVNKEKIAVTGAYVIVYMGNRYFIKRTRKGSYLSYDVMNYQVKKFLTEKAALAKLKMFDNSEDYKVVYKIFDAPIYI